MPTPPLSSSIPSPHEWTHRPILNFLPEQDKDSLRQLLLTLWFFDTWLVSKFQCCPWMSWKLLWIRKGWTANPPDRPDNQRANSMLLNDDCTYRGGGELVFGSENKLYHANKPRDRKEATNYKESFIQQSATSTRWAEWCGRIRQQLIKQTDVMRQQEGTNMRGSPTRNKQKE